MKALLEKLRSCLPYKPFAPCNSGWPRLKADGSRIVYVDD